MNKLIVIINNSLLISSSWYRAKTELYPHMIREEKVIFERQVKNCLAKSRQKVNKMIQNIGNGGKVIAPADRLRLESAKTALNAKLNLINNLKDTEVVSCSSILHHPFITTLLNRDKITEIDLLKFHSEINQVKSIIS